MRAGGIVLTGSLCNNVYTIDAEVKMLNRGRQ